MKKVHKKMQKLVNSFDKEINSLWAMYNSLHEELNKYRGVTLEKKEDIDKVNKLLYDIQDVFYAVHPALYFIAARHPFVLNATNSHNEFIEQIKSSGASEMKSPPQEDNSYSAKATKDENAVK